MSEPGNKVAVSVFLGAVLIAAALYFGLTRTKDSVFQPSPGTAIPESSPMVEQPGSESGVPETPTTTASPEPPLSAPEITWTKSDIIEALSIKTGIPETEVVFSTGEVVDHGNTKLIRGTVQRQGEMGGAGFFAVADTNGVNVTYAGQGMPNCTEVNPYGYPVSWADYCMDGANTVKR